jgi:hypothetical protein
MVLSAFLLFLSNMLLLVVQLLLAFLLLTAFLLLLSEYRIKALTYRTIGYRTQKNYQLLTSVKHLGLAHLA